MTPDLPTPLPKTARLGRPLGARSKRTIDEQALEFAASEALRDGRLCLTIDRLAYALQVDRGTAQSLVDSGLIPAVYVEADRQRRSPRVLAVDLLFWLRSRSTHRAAAT
jgi:hypothetical protein